MAIKIHSAAKIPIGKQFKGSRNVYEIASADRNEMN